MYNRAMASVWTVLLLWVLSASGEIMWEGRGALSSLSLARLDNLKRQRATTVKAQTQEKQETKKYFSRLGNGTVADIKQFPWQVLVRKKKVKKASVCGGNLISDTHVLTSGHCIVNKSKIHPADPKIFTVRAGSTNRGRGGQIRNVTGVHLHPNYRGNRTFTYVYDLGVLSLESPLVISPHVQVIQVADVSVFNHIQRIQEAGDTCWVAGWGRPLQGYQQKPEEMYAVRVPLITIEYCQKLLTEHSVKGWRVHTLYHLCTHGIRNDTCRGDSGGGLVCLNEWGIKMLAGVVSFGEPCDSRVIPKVYTRVDTARRFLAKATGQKSHVALASSASPRTSVPCLFTFSWAVFKRFFLNNWCTLIFSHRSIH